MIVETHYAGEVYFGGYKLGWKVVDICDDKYSAHFDK